VGKRLQNAELFYFTKLHSAQSESSLQLNYQTKVIIVL